MAYDERGPELAGLGVTDLLGLTPQSQFALAKFRLMYSPGMYHQALQTGILRWRGTFIVGGGFVRDSIFGTLATAMPGGETSRMGRATRAAGTFFGGTTGRGAQFFDPRNRDMLNARFRSGELFTPGGFRKAAQDISAGRFYGMDLQGLKPPPPPGYFGRPRKFFDFARKAQTDAFMHGGGSEISDAMMAEERLSFAKAAIPLRRTGSMQVAAYTGLRVMGVVSTLATVGLAFEVGALAGYGTVAAAQAIQRKLATGNMLDFGTGQFQAAMTSGAATERQRALRAIQEHQLNARRMMGQEATLMHS